jgi:hypothetical protein
MVCPTGRLAGTLTAGRLTVRGSGPEQSLYAANVLVDAHAAAMSSIFLNKLSSALDIFESRDLGTPRRNAGLRLKGYFAMEIVGRDALVDDQKILKGLRLFVWRRHSARHGVSGGVAIRVFDEGERWRQSRNGFTAKSCGELPGSLYRRVEIR